MQQGSWLITPGNGAISAAQCWSLFLEDWKVSTSHGYIALGQWKSMLPSLCITYISAPMATLIISPWKNKDRNCWGKSLTSIHRIGLIHVIIKILCWGHPFISIQIGQKYFHVLCVLGEVYPHISSDLLATNFLIVFLLSPWPPSQTIGHSPWIAVDSYLWPSG